MKFVNIAYGIYIVCNSKILSKNYKLEIIIWTRTVTLM